MTSERNPNLDFLMLGVDKLGELCDEMVFLGGCTTGLLITDPAAPPVRETKDIDVIIEITTKAEYYKLSKKLRALGFKEDQTEGAPICRWKSEGIILDVMPTDSEILGFSNEWYEDAMEKADEYILPNGKIIKIVTPPYFLATKIEAFEGRGEGDYLLSHDLEDLLAIIDGRPEIVEEILNADQNLKYYLKEKFETLLKEPRFIEALPGKLPGDKSSQERIPFIIDRINKFIDSS